MSEYADRPDSERTLELLEKTFRLKLGLETIGTPPPLRPPENPVPPIVDPTSLPPDLDPASDPESIPEPSSLLGLLIISLLPLLPGNNKA